MQQPWKFITNSLIQPFDNVYGVPWVVAAVKGLPAFDQFCADTCYGLTRKLNFHRPSTLSGLPDETNQFYEISISNRFGIEAWNSYRTAFTVPVDIHATNIMEITLTNGSANYPWGTNIFLTNSVNLFSNVWPGWISKADPKSMWTPLLTNAVFFASSDGIQPRKYSDVMRRFYDLADQTAPAWDHKTYSVHRWMVTVTNYLTYVLQEHAVNYGGAILDFVNLGPFGTSLDFMQVLNPALKPPRPASWDLVWQTNNADDSPSSRFSLGAQKQIEIAYNEQQLIDYVPSNSVAFETSSTAAPLPPTSWTARSNRR